MTEDQINWLLFLLTIVVVLAVWKWLLENY